VGEARLTRIPAPQRRGASSPPAVPGPGTSNPRNSPPSRARWARLPLARHRGSTEAAREVVRRERLGAMRTAALRAAWLTVAAVGSLGCAKPPQRSIPTPEEAAATVARALRRHVLVGVPREISDPFRAHYDISSSDWEGLLAAERAANAVPKAGSLDQPSRSRSTSRRNRPTQVGSKRCARPLRPSRTLSIRSCGAPTGRRGAVAGTREARGTGSRGVATPRDGPQGATGPLCRLAPRRSARRMQAELGQTALRVSPHRRSLIPIQQFGSM
jgi:hypothetical protein